MVPKPNPDTQNEDPSDDASKTSAHVDELIKHVLSGAQGRIDADRARLADIQAGRPALSYEEHLARIARL